jgi:hypothetical protein
MVEANVPTIGRGDSVELRCVFGNDAQGYINLKQYADVAGNYILHEGGAVNDIRYSEYPVRTTTASGVNHSVVLVEPDSSTVNTPAFWGAIDEVSDESPIANVERRVNVLNFSFTIIALQSNAYSRNELEDKLHKSIV